jgi:hypothetical protein
MYGHGPTTVNATCPTCGGTAGSLGAFHRIGADFSTTFNGEWNLFGAMIHGNDSKQLFIPLALIQGVSQNAVQNASWNGGFVELDYYPSLLPILKMTDWFFSYRYDIIRNDRQGFASFNKNFNNVDSHTVAVRYFLHQSTRTDVALHMEYNWYRDRSVAANGADLIGQTVLTGVDFAF